MNVKYFFKFPQKTNHLYFCDCLDIMKDISNNSIDLILTDPPYGVNFKNNFYDDSLSNILEQMPLWYKEWYRILKEDSYLILFVGIKTIHYWIQEGINAGFNYKNIIATRCFNNGNINPKNNLGFQFQPILVFSKGKGKPLNEVDFILTSKEWLKDKRNKNPKLFTYNYPNFWDTKICFATEKRASKNLHPNEKNVKLLENLIKLTTKENDLVLDCFAGCGSTGVASKNTNRDFLGIEINEKYYKLIKERCN